MILIYIFLLKYSIQIDKYDLIIIDEAQFFNDLVEFTQMCLGKGKFVIVAGLQADHKGKKFGKIIDLIPFCSDIKRLHAYCKICANNKKCKKAIYSKKILNTKEEEWTGVGGGAAKKENLFGAPMIASNIATTII